VLLAHREAECIHLRLAKIHEDAALFWDERGLPLLAAREREKAELDRDSAKVESEPSVVRR
jgi:hypothetical protein